MEEDRFRQPRTIELIRHHQAATRTTILWLLWILQSLNPTQPYKRFVHLPSRPRFSPGINILGTPGYYY